MLPVPQMSIGKATRALPSATAGTQKADTPATVSRDNAIVFENGAGTVCGTVTLDGSYNVPAGYTLNIPANASLSGSSTLSGGGTFTTEI